jgi:ABC-type multidrug transport system ATPase subunit
MTDSPAVAAVDVWRAFQRERVLTGVRVEIPRGCGVAILGPNGAGKSTFLRVCAGALRPQRGWVRIYGEDLWRVPAARGRIGFVGHEPMLYGGLTVLENLRLFASLYDLPDGAARADEVCTLLDIRRRHDPVRNLSRGLQQRAALARAIAHRPEVLLLDEPLTGLDPDAAHRLCEFLEGFRARGGTVVAATHSPAEALRIADRAYVLTGGRLSEVRILDGMTADAVQAWYRLMTGARERPVAGPEDGAGLSASGTEPSAYGVSQRCTRERRP